MSKARYVNIKVGTQHVTVIVDAECVEYILRIKHFRFGPEGKLCVNHQPYRRGSIAARLFGDHWYYSRHTTGNPLDLRRSAYTLNSNWYESWKKHFN